MSYKGRLYWYSEKLETDPGWEDNMKLVSSSAAANLIGSLTETGKHKPTLDIDLPCQLVESKTEGHYHLYIDKELTHDQYERLIETLADLGIVSEGIRKQFRKRGMTCLRSKPENKTYVGSSSDEPQRDAFQRIIVYIEENTNNVHTKDRVRNWLYDNEEVAINEIQHNGVERAKRNLYNLYTSQAKDYYRKAL